MNEPKSEWEMLLTSVAVDLGDIRQKALLPAGQMLAERIDKTLRLARATIQRALEEKEAETWRSAASQAERDATAFRAFRLYAAAAEKRAKQMGA